MTHGVVIKRIEANLYVLTGKDNYNILNEGKTKLPYSGYIVYNANYLNKSIDTHTFLYTQKMLHDVFETISSSFP